jgi:hypothetical protein
MRSRFFLSTKLNHFQPHSQVQSPTTLPGAVSASCSLLLVCACARGSGVEEDAVVWCSRVLFSSPPLSTNKSVDSATAHSGLLQH